MKANATRVLVAVITVVVVVAALRWSAAVTLPLAFSLFLVALFWPLYGWLESRVPRGLAALTTLGSFLFVLGLIGSGLWYGAEVVARGAPEYAPKLNEAISAIKAWADTHHLPVPEMAASDLARQLQRISRNAVDVLASTVLVCALFVLGLIEVRAYRRRIERGTHGNARAAHIREVLDRIGRDFRRYVLVRTLIGLITGVAVWIGALLIGLDFAFVWGLTNFLLNYIPTLGSILGVIPPALFALVQFDLTTALLAIAVVGGIQLIMGNYVDPLLQGRYLKLSPFVVLLSVVLWGFVWGIGGAFIGVPMTIVIVLVCRQFPRTRWIATLLADAPEDAARHRKRTSARKAAGATISHHPAT